MNDRLEKWTQWRNNVSDHCNGNWVSMAQKYANNDAVNTLLGGTNITCPECGHSQKLFLVNLDTLSAACCRPTCKKAYYDGIATIAALDDISHSDLVKKISDGERLNNDNDSNYQSNKRLFSNQPTNSKETPISTTPIKPKENKWAVIERQNLLSNMSLVNSEKSVVCKYIENRGIRIDDIISSIFKNLYFIDNLDYYKKILDNKDVVIEIEKGKYPSMVAKVLDCNFNLVGFHKTYLQLNGTKADVHAPKQLAKSLHKGIYSKNGSIIPLCTPNKGRYGISEGIETSFAILAMNRPCWSVLNANGIKSFIPPKDCLVLDIYGDLDASGTGQQVIIDKYIELLVTRPNIKVNLYLPPETHWNYEENPKGIDFLNSYIVDQKCLPALGGFTC